MLFWSLSGEDVRRQKKQCLLPRPHRRVHNIEMGGTGGCDRLMLVETYGLVPAPCGCILKNTVYFSNTGPRLPDHLASATFTFPPMQGGRAQPGRGLTGFP